MIGDKHLWGESWTIYRDKSVWVVGFRGKAGGKSSLHYHERMVHTVYVLNGALVMGYDPPRFSMMQPGCVVRILPLQEHQLRFAEDTEGIETYYALPGHEIDEHDIVRLSPGRAPGQSVGSSVCHLHTPDSGDADAVPA